MIFLFIWLDQSVLLPNLVLPFKNFIQIFFGVWKIVVGSFMNVATSILYNENRVNYSQDTYKTKRFFICLKMSWNIEIRVVKIMSIEYHTNSLDYSLRLSEFVVRLSLKVLSWYLDSVWKKCNHTTNGCRLQPGCKS